jgi:hypothetical protein
MSAPVSDKPMKTFLVIPDKYDGGMPWEMIVRALTPRDACQAVRTYLGAVDEITDFKEIDEAAPADTIWVTREFPDIEKSYGVVDWRRFKVTTLTPVRKQPLQEGYEVGRAAP